MILTGLLTLVYVAVVVLATQVLSFQTPAAVAVVTVAAALLFNLPRRRLQRAVRRRYHRPA
jgi:Flp pilus assembly protein TadB